MSSVGGTIKYRKALLSDYDGVMGIGSVYGGRDYLWCLYKQLITDPDKYGVVAVDGDKVVGFYMTSTFDGGRTVLKRSGRVSEDYRGRGIYHAMEAELDKHTLEHRPGATHDSFAKTGREDHLSGKFLDIGYQEVYRKDMHHMKLIYLDLQRPQLRTSSKPVLVREVQTEDLKHLFTKGEVTRKLFPSGRLLNTYMPYRLLDVNIPYIICDRGGAFVSFENPDVADQLSTDQTLTQIHFHNVQTNHKDAVSSPTFRAKVVNSSSVRHIAMISFYYCYPTPTAFLYYIDLYAKKHVSPNHLCAHLGKHLESLQQYFPNQDGLLTVAHDSNILTNDVVFCLKDHGIVDQLKDQEKAQVLFERGRVECRFHVDKTSQND